MRYYFRWIVTVDLTAVLKYLLLFNLASREIVNILLHPGTSNSPYVAPSSTNSGKEQDGILRWHLTSTGVIGQDFFL